MAANTEAHATLFSAMSESADELLELHRSLVQIPSVNRGDGSSADEDKVAEAAASYLHNAGIESRIVAGAPGRANLLASLPGKTSPEGKSLLLMGHSDVVPASDASKWRYPPFSAEVAEGRIWGRGSNDCKMLVACELFVATTLARTGLLAHGELRIAVGADEEAGGKWGFGWLAENEPDFLRADLAINEGGGAYFGLSAQGDRLFTLGCGEKGRYEVIFRAEGPGTHASVPWGKSNPIAEIAKLSERVAKWNKDPTPAPQPASPIFRNLRSQLAMSGETSAENLEETIDLASTRSEAFANSLRAQSRLTIVPTILSAGEKSNAVPAEAELRCDARLYPGQPRTVLDEAIQSLLSGFPNISVEIEETAAASVSSVDDATIALFEGALDQTFADGSSPCKIVPNWCTGFTDSRFVRSVGTPTYGFQVVEPGADPDSLSIHCIDESIEVGMLLPCALALGHLALDFCDPKRES